MIQKASGQKSHAWFFGLYLPLVDKHDHKNMRTKRFFLVHQVFFFFKVRKDVYGAIIVAKTITNAYFEPQIWLRSCIFGPPEGARTTNNSDLAGMSLIGPSTKLNWANLLVQKCKRAAVCMTWCQRSSPHF